MATLTSAQRKAMPQSEYAVAGKRYPVNDVGHAKAALARVNQGNLSPEQKMQVIRRAHAVLAGK